MYAIAGLQIVIRSLKPDYEQSFQHVEELRSFMKMFTHC